MRRFISVCIFTLFILILSSSNTRTNMSDKSYTFLALGDSYTIGESVSANDNFPNQVVQLLRKVGFDFRTPEIIAKTGWTTDELLAAIHNQNLLVKYDFVTLLIGVNNQYRGRTVDNYKTEFENLLKQAIQFADDNKNHVIVLSIPDWGVTPFAEGRDRQQISNEIDNYNAANKQIAERYGVQYLDITPWTREAATDISLLANDGLHPSGKEYKRWAEKLSNIMKSTIR